MQYRSVISSLAFTAAANAALHTIDVGEGGITYTPNSVTAEVGDTVTFRFYSGTGNHNVVAGSFDSPCQPAEGGLYSTYIKGDDTGTPTFEVTVTSTDPIYFYCSLNQHCQNGMVGAINPAEDRTVEAYQEAAAGADRNVAPMGGVVGGTLNTGGSSDATSSADSMESMSMPMTSTSMADSSSMVEPTTMAESSAAPTSSTATSPTPAETTTASSSPAPSESAAATTTNTAGTTQAPIWFGLAVALGGFVALMV